MYYAYFNCIYNIILYINYILCIMHTLIAIHNIILYINYILCIMHTLIAIHNIILYILYIVYYAYFNCMRMHTVEPR